MTDSVDRVGCFGLGYRVVRGPDWMWGNQDITEGYVGTVVKVFQPGEPQEKKNHVIVQWDCGSKQTYRVGHDGCFDLRVFDNAQDGTKHPHITCDECLAEGIQGIRWKCSVCHDYDICTTCYSNDKHDLSHQFLRIDNPWSKEHDLVPKRLESQKVQAMGVFRFATVCRGPDWKWDDQDGGAGKEGIVHNILSWNSKSVRSKSAVIWNAGTYHKYRMGLEGMVDLTCLRATSGGYYYRDHMPVFGKIEEPAKKETTLFKLNDLVKCQVDLKTLRTLQQDHGGFSHSLSNLMNKVGRVAAIDKDDDVIVCYTNQVQVTYNPEALCKVWLNDPNINPSTPETAVQEDVVPAITLLATPPSTVEYNEKLQCKICLSKEACVTFIPCGHLVSCPECSEEMEKCPSCRSDVKNWIRTYIS